MDNVNPILIEKPESTKSIEELISQRVKHNTDILSGLYNAQDQAEKASISRYKELLNGRQDLLEAVQKLNPSNRDDCVDSLSTILASTKPPVEIEKSLKYVVGKVTSTPKDELTQINSKQANLEQIKYILRSTLAEGTVLEQSPKIGWASFDMNNLTFLNNIFFHARGDLGLKMFANAISSNSSFSIKTIQELGYDLTPCRDHGDEFSAILKGIDRAAPLIEVVGQITQFYLEELQGQDTSELVHFDPVIAVELKERIRSNGIEIEDDEKLLILFGGSIGVASLEEALVLSDLSTAQSFEEALNTILCVMINTADSRAISFKAQTKKAIESAKEYMFKKYKDDKGTLNDIKFMFINPRNPEQLLQKTDVGNEELATQLELQEYLAKKYENDIKPSLDEYDKQIIDHLEKETLDRRRRRSDRRNKRFSK